MKTKDAKRIARELARERDVFDDIALAAIQEALERAFPRTRWGRHLSEAIASEIAERKRGAENLQKWLPVAMPVPATLHGLTKTLHDAFDVNHAGGIRGIRMDRFINDAKGEKA